MKTSGFEAALERKRKRPYPDQPHLRQLNSGDSSDGKTTSGSSEEAAKDATAKPSLPPPKDEEVEEFFAILRRIASVKYVGNSANSNGNGKMRWTALDAGSPFTAPSLNGGKRKLKKDEAKAGGKAKNCVSFDLNAVPADAAEANGD